MPVTLSTEGRAVAAQLFDARYGEPWRPAKTADGILCEAHPSGIGRMHPLTVEYYGGLLAAESMCAEHRQRVIDVVNFCAGVELPEVASDPSGVGHLGGLQRVLHALEVANRAALRGVRGFESMDVMIQEMENVHALLRAFGRDV
jgi:hypothetical protein